MPCVTVVIPARNRASLLEQTLRSVDQQTHPPFEVIVADDGSTDETAGVVAAHGATRLHNASGDWGAAGARNAGLRVARGDLVAFVDSDDLLLPTALERLATGLVRAPGAPFAYGWGLSAVRRPSGWQPTGLIASTRREQGDPLRSLFANNYVPSSGALVRTEAALAVGGYGASLTFSEDHHLWLRLARRGGPARVDDLVCVYRQHEGNRHSPALALRDERSIWQLAEEDPRLAGGGHDRLGVQLCEYAIEAWHARRPQAVALLVRETSRSGRRAPTVLACGLRHFGERRRRGRRAHELWRRRDDLRHWLAGF